MNLLAGLKHNHKVIREKVYHHKTGNTKKFVENFDLMKLLATGQSLGWPS